MDNQIAQIAERIRGLRDLEDITLEEMAKATDKTAAEYEEYEQGKHDFSFSFLYTVANKLGVDITDLLTGENAKLHRYAYTKAGQGLKMERRKAYKYQHLAAIFQDRHMEPFLVTVEPKDDESVKKHAHEGQEFNYIVSGAMTVFIGDRSILLQPGDSIYFDSREPHAMRAEGSLPCQFIAVISGKED